MRALSVLMMLLCVAMPHAVEGQDAVAKEIEIEKGRSPDGRYLLRVMPPDAVRDYVCLEVVHVSTKVVVGRLPEVMSDTDPAAAARPENTYVLWSPDSKHVAIMQRSTRRTSEVRVYAVTAGGMTLVALPSATDAALELMGVATMHRFVSQKPVKWQDADTLLVLAGGDALGSETDAKPVQYVVHVTYQIAEREVSDVALVEERREGG